MVMSILREGEELLICRHGLISTRLWMAWNIWTNQSMDKDFRIYLRRGIMITYLVDVVSQYMVVESRIQ